MRLQDNLTNDHEKRYNSIHQQRNLLNVLRRSIEIAAYSVEKLRFRTTEKFVMNFIAQAAQFTVAFLASEALLDGFS